MLLNKDEGTVGHHLTSDLPDLLAPESLLVFNDSRVRRARLFAKDTTTNAAAEFLLIHQLDPFTWTALTKHASGKRPGHRYVVDGGIEAEVTAIDGELRTVKFDAPVDDFFLDSFGHVPLPPYIKRADSDFDAERYQTVYAKKHGSTAAPTAGLHFTNELLGRIAARGIESAFVTLHVGLGTFLPVRTENLEDHKMHEEFFYIDEEAALKIEKAKREGRKITAVGTTSVRTLESAWDGGKIKRGGQSTSIFIHPPYRFRIVDSIFTNFHTPKSTLLMLVCAFAGKRFMLDSYEAAGAAATASLATATPC
jgi:S-adenosylmethionine:tRNA ribosyltransferase-isomerase